MDIIYTMNSLPSIKSFIKAVFVGQVPLGGNLDPGQLGTPRTCPNIGLSCPSIAGADTCCINSPGGQFALTQFWNSNPRRGPPGYLGPENSWTIHGLWPDRCDGNYDESCDSTRIGSEYHSVTNILKKWGHDELLSYMETYWKGINGDEHLWEHEWAHHGTCVSTLEPKCYDEYKSTQEVVDYAKRTVEVFKTLPTYDWLAAANILPSSSRTYTLAEIKDAIEAPRGVSAVIGCQGNELREIWYHFGVRGSLQSGDFIPMEPDFSGPGRPSTHCPPHGIRYLPKSRDDDSRPQPPPTHTRTSAVPSGTSTPSGKGYVVVRLTSGTVIGCLISNGKWFNTVIGSSCATYRSEKDGDLFKLKTRKGPCGVEDNAFSCSDSAIPTVFQLVNGKLVLPSGDTEWSAEKLPRGTRQETVYTAQHTVGFELEWREI